MPSSVQTIIIGGGQAGLAMSYHLARRAREHVVIERGRIAERWQSERWDTLAFQFTNAMLRLPGYTYKGPAPDAFMGRDGVAQFIIDYAMRLAPPLICGIEVTSLRQTDRGRFLVAAGQTQTQSENVVVATGPYQRPAIPPCSAKLPLSIHQVTANRYKRPTDLPPGNVLVVGSGGSGCQIVEDLVQAGRNVFYSVRRHRRVPRNYRGHDVGWWFEQTGATDMTVDGLPPLWLNFKAPLMTGVQGGHTIDLRQLARQGVTLLGGLMDVVNGRAHFATDLNANLQIGDDTFVQFVREVDGFVERSGISAPKEDRFDPYLRDRPPALQELDALDLGAANITTVIWATGYRFDFGWIHCAVFDERGVPQHQRGVTRVPGLYFLGLPRLHKIKSSFLWGVGEDADFLANHMTERTVGPAP